MAPASKVALRLRESVQRVGEVVLSELKSLTLSNNDLNDASITALSGAVGGGALRGCKKVALDGNPASKATVKAVKSLASSAAVADFSRKWQADHRGALF